MPETLDWDLWLGPAQYRPYHPAYVPVFWRSWINSGTEPLGDMAAISSTGLLGPCNLAVP